MNTGKHINVTCAIIERDGLVLAAQRSAVMSLPLKWEFPGGKIEKGESPAMAGLREVREECGILNLVIVNDLPSTYHTYKLEAYHYKY